MSEVKHSIALLGNPNSGKTALFNLLTGLNQKVSNYPGVTVEQTTGIAQINNTPVTIIDLPGHTALLRNLTMKPLLRQSLGNGLKVKIHLTVLFRWLMLPI